MSGRLIATGRPAMASPAGLGARRPPAAAAAALSTARARLYHHVRTSTGGLLRADADAAALRYATRRRLRLLPLPGAPFHGQAVTHVRNASFARFLPKLVFKLARIPTLFGGLAIASFAWVQYQATRKFRRPSLPAAFRRARTPTPPCCNFLC